MAQDLIFEYFCRPIIDSSVQGYNLVNTATYALILFAVIWFGIIPLLKKQKIPLNAGFMLSLFPFVLAGAAFRTFTDAGVFQKTCNPFSFEFFTFTPGIWIAIGAITIASLLIARTLAKSNDKKFSIYFGAIGTAIAIPIVVPVLLKFVAWEGALLVVGAVLGITFFTKLVVEKFREGFFDDKLNLLVVAGQALDGASTIVATSFYNCGEQHPLSEALLNFNPLVFPLVKVILALLIIHYADKDIEDEKTRAFLKIAVTILGFATGGRNFFTLGSGNCL